MGPTVIVIDDEPGVLDLLGDLLELAGFSVVCLAVPQQVEARAVAEQAGLFLIDIMLPGISGIELAQHLRAQAFPQTPMIAMSASPVMVRMARSTGLFQDTIS